MFKFVVIPSSYIVNACKFRQLSSSRARNVTFF